MKLAVMYVTAPEDMNTEELEALLSIAVAAVGGSVTHLPPREKV